MSSSWGQSPVLGIAQLSGTADYFRPGVLEMQDVEMRAMSWVTSNWFLLFSLLHGEREKICDEAWGNSYITNHISIYFTTWSCLSTNPTSSPVLVSFTGHLKNKLVQEEFSSVKYRTRVGFYRGLILQSFIWSDNVTIFRVNFYFSCCRLLPG